MKVKLHRAQYEVATDNHRFRIICAGRRWGKSVLSRLIILKYALQAQGLYWIVSPTYRQGKQNHWQNLKKEIPQSLITKTNEVELSLTLRNGSVIQLKGAENPDSLRGVKLRFLVVDEIASIRGWDWLWYEVLRPTLTDYEAPAFFISTPKGFNHFYKLYEQGQESDAQYKSWRFTSYDNPYIPKKEIDNAKTELTESTFAQEYLADFRKFTGLIYKEFDRATHVIKPFDLPESFEIYRTLDFGSTNPTACLWIATDGDYNFFIIDEYYQTGRTIDEHAGIINANQYSHNTVQTFGDPSGAQWIKEFEWRKIFITPAAKEVTQQWQSWVRLGIEKVAEKLKPTPGHAVPIIQSQGMYTRSIEQSMPSLYVTSNCTNTIKEFEAYRWREKQVTSAQDLNEPDVPEKAMDHCLRGETLVDTTKGSISIRDLVGKEGYVYSENGKIRKFYNVRQTRHEEIYIIEFEDGRVVYCSPEHPFLLTDNRMIPACLLMPNDLIQSVTYGYNYSFIKKAAVQWRKILLWIWQILQTFIQNTFFVTSPSSLGVSQWQNTDWLSRTSLRWGLAQQSNKQSRTQESGDTFKGTYDESEKTTGKDMDQYHQAFSQQMARFKSREDAAFQDWQRFMAKEKRDSPKMLSLWKRICYAVSDAIKVLPPELQNECKTQKIVRVSRRYEQEPVYALEVEGTRTFSINGGLIVLNSMDALRYFVVSYKKSSKWVLPANDISNANWGLTQDEPYTQDSVDWSLT